MDHAVLSYDAVHAASAVALDAGAIAALSDGDGGDDVGKVFTRWPPELNAAGPRVLGGGEAVEERMLG